MTPLPNETIFYSSLVMDSYGDSQKLFEQVDGKIREKILGIKLLEANQLSKEKQKVAFRDVAETALLVCGYFADSLNNKIIDIKYYHDLGKIAYSRLNSITPEAYDMPSFFKVMSNSFSDIALLMNLVSKKHTSDKDIPWLIITERKVS